LTDDEWAVDEPIVHKIGILCGRPSTCDLRLIIDGNIEKLSISKSWHEVGDRQATKVVTASYYRRMSRDGRWERIVKILAESEVCRFCEAIHAAAGSERSHWRRDCARARRPYPRA
jgi:hypothetical protein